MLLRLQWRPLVLHHLGDTRVLLELQLRIPILFIMTILIIILINFNRVRPKLIDLCFDNQLLFCLEAMVVCHDAPFNGLVAAAQGQNLLLYLLLPVLHLLHFLLGLKLEEERREKAAHTNDSDRNRVQLHLMRVIL